MTALDLRDKLIDARQRFGRNEITIDELYAAADAYIQAIIDFKKRTNNKKLPVPTRSRLMRMV